MKNIEEVFVDGDKVYLKKGTFGYRIVQPIKDNEGKTILINLLIGGWGNFFKLLFILFIVFAFLYGAKEMMGSCNDMAENPCSYFDVDCSIETYGYGLDLGGGVDYGGGKK